MKASQKDERTSTSRAVLKPSSGDFYCFLYWFSVYLTSVTVTQNVQDKICLNKHDLPQVLCSEIERYTDLKLFQNDIITSASAYKTGEALVVYLPALVVMLFLGHWLDKHPQLIKYTLAAPSLGNLIRSVVEIYLCRHFKTDHRYFLYAHIPFSLLGGNTAIYSSMYTYVSKRSSENERLIRFGIVEFCKYLGASSGNIMGGYILSSEPWFDNQLRNYIGVYSASGCVSLIAIIVAMTMLGDGRRANERESLTKRDCHQRDETPHQDTSEKRISDIVKGKNLVAMAKTVGRRRAQRKHLIVWHLMASLCFTYFFLRGESSIDFLYVQKIFFWRVEFYTTIRGILDLFPMFGSILLPTVFLNTLKWTDGTIGILGCTCSLTTCIILGSPLKPWTYFIAESLESFSKLLFISFRSILSKIVEFDEVGQIFTLLACIEAVLPIVSTTFYTFIFNQTLDTYPGLVFHIIAVIMIYPLLVVIWLDLTERRNQRHSTDLRRHNEHSPLLKDTNKSYTALE